MDKITRIVLTLVVSLTVGLAGCGPANQQSADKDRATLHYQLGLGSLAQQDFTSALAELMRARSFDPTSAEINHALGLAYHGKGRADEAIEAYKNAIKAKPDFSAAHNNLGIVYLSLKEYDLARKSFEAALENILYPSPQNAYLNLGILAMEEGNFQDADAYFGRAKKAAPRFCGAYYYAAKSQRKQKRINTAIENIQLAIKFCPDFAEAYRYGGILWLMKKKPKTAVKYFSRAYKLSPDSEVGRESKRYLKLLNHKK